MTTTVVKKVGSAGAGRDYSSWQTWNDDAPADLVAADIIWEGQGYNDSEFVGSTNTFIHIAGSTSSSSCYKSLRPAAGQGKTSGAAYYDAAAGVAIRSSDSYGIMCNITEANVRLHGLQMQSHGAAQVIQAAAANILIDDCLLIAGAGAGQSVLVSGVGSSVKLTNTLCTSAVEQGNISSLELYNCTLLGRIQKSYTPGAIVKNTFASTFIGQFDSGCTHNASLDATAPGASPQQSLTASAIFVNATNDFTPKAGGDLLLHGVRDQTNTNDLDAFGNSRDITTPTIGAFEGVASSPATAATLSGPTSGATGADSSNFTITLDHPATATYTFTPAGTVGTVTPTPTSPQITPGNSTVTFKVNPATDGAHVISITNDGGLSNLNTITYTSSTGATPKLFRASLGGGLSGLGSSGGFFQSPLQ